MDILEIAISFIIGLGLIVVLGIVFSLKTKGIMRLLINALCGCAVLILCSVFKVIYLPLNPLNALITGFLGIPGLIVVYLLVMFL